MAAYPPDAVGLIVERIAAGVLAVAAAIPTVMAFSVAMLNALTAAKGPDPSVRDGDPCCAHPDTWGEVALGLAYAAVFGAGALAVGYLAVRLGRYAVSGPRPNRR